MIARRVLLRALAGGAGATALRGALGKIAEAADASSGSDVQGPVSPDRNFNTPFGRLFKSAEIEQDILNQWRHVRRLDPEIACLKSVSETYRMKMQLEKWRAEQTWWSRMRFKMWGH